MYSNPLGPAAATGVGATAGISGWMIGSVWLMLAAFALIGAFFALKRILPSNTAQLKATTNKAQDGRHRRRY